MALCICLPVSPPHHHLFIYFMCGPSTPLQSILFHPLFLKTPSPADRDGVPERSNLVLAPILILIKLISSLFQGSNRGIHYCTDREKERLRALGVWRGAMELIW